MHDEIIYNLAVIIMQQECVAFFRHISECYIACSTIFLVACVCVCVGCGSGNNIFGGSVHTSWYSSDITFAVKFRISL